MDAELQKAAKPKVAAVLKDFPRALYAVTQVMEFGASKPGRRIGGWAADSNVSDTYFEDPLLRHWLQQQLGEECDSESNLLHKAHLACNALMDLEMTLRRKAAQEGKHDDAVDAIAYVRGAGIGRMRDT